MTDKEFTVDFSTGVQYDLDEIRKRRSTFMPDNRHAWVISTVYAIDDPELAMDSMDLNAENFVGVSNIHCLLCNEEYTTAKRYYKCPQVAS